MREDGFGATASLRGMSALLETLSIPFFYLVAKRILQDKFAILMAVGLYALSSFQVQYAQEARCYGVLAFCSMASLYCLIVFLNTQWTQNRRKQRRSRDGPSGVRAALR